MKSAIGEWSKKAVLALLIIAILLLGLNFLLSYIATHMVYSFTSKNMDSSEKNPEFNLRVNLVPYPKLIDKKLNNDGLHSNRAIFTQS